MEAFLFLFLQSGGWVFFDSVWGNREGWMIFIYVVLIAVGGNNIIYMYEHIAENMMETCRI